MPALLAQVVSKAMSKWVGGIISSTPFLESLQYPQLPTGSDDEKEIQSGMLTDFPSNPFRIIF
jgi:hypothetical protein